MGSGVTGASPAGMIAPFAMASAPTGWLICNGSRVSTTTYAALVTAIYVGDGSNASTSIEWGQKWDAATGGSRSTSGTYLSLPDLEGAFLRGTGGNATHTMADGNDFTGPAVGAFEDDQTQRHKHTTSIASTLPTASDWGFVESSSNNRGPTSYTSSSPATDSFGTPRTGDETRPFNAGVNYCIKF